MAAKGPFPANESARLAALAAIGLEQGDAHPSHNDIAALAADLFQTPMAHVSIVARDHQWFLGRRGLQFAETPRDVSFCTHVVAANAPVVVLDARRDARFAHNPFVLGPPYVRFYAGAPIFSASGLCLGAVCIADSAAREAFGPVEHAQLLRLARLAEAHVQAHMNERRVVDADADRDEAEYWAHAVLDEARDAFTACDRLAISLDRHLRDAVQRAQRQIEDMRAHCATPEAHGLRMNVVAEIAAMFDMSDEMAAIARLDAHTARRSVAMFAPAPMLSDVVSGIEAVAAMRKVSVVLGDATCGDAMLADPYRFEELLEQLLSDLVAQSEHATIVVEAAFELAAPRGARLTLRFHAEGEWETRVEGWRLSPRSRELIGAMSGAWDVLADQRRMAVSLPARLRAPARLALRKPASHDASIHASRRENAYEVTL
ncbi:MAG TPA: GAF domain-containing protein [Caulobacterales bacterium]|nr:GAF domain-containing protein [Caulobacterales bacterium]